MKSVTSAIMKDLDKKTIADFGIRGEDLMDRAGVGIANTVQFLARITGQEDPLIVLFAGRGNNGGDAFAAARHLKERDFETEVWLAADPAVVSGEALHHLTRLRASKIPLHELPTKADWDDELASGEFPIGCIIVDGILGIGTRGPARGPAAGAISYINALSRRNLVVSIDIPSGLDSDTGEAPGDVVVADITSTMGLPKIGMLQPQAVEYVGSVEVIDIGLPRQLTQRLESDLELITTEDLRSVFTRRSRSSHKGTYGNLLVIAGSPGFSGAAVLSAAAAIRSGVGLVTVLTPASVAGIVAGIVPEAMVHSGQVGPSGVLSADSLAKWGKWPGDFTAVLVGPGLTASPDTFSLVEKLISESSVPLVLDADALNVCEGHMDLIRNARCPIIVTPHPGEMARLTGVKIPEVQADRFGAARRFAADTSATVVLKGAGTVVASKDKTVHVNLNGNPGMATGGMGDVLGGFIAGLSAQGIAPVDAARAGVYIHGRAGDNMAWRTSQAGLNAGDIIAELATVYREITIR